MHRSSESIANLSGALAKAQAELTNPEKSLLGTIRASGPRGADQTFRYAPLSSGLDIVRKTLGQHEIAIMQTTALDQTAGIFCTIGARVVSGIHPAGQIESERPPPKTIAEQRQSSKQCLEIAVVVVVTDEQQLERSLGRLQFGFDFGQERAGILHE